MVNVIELIGDIESTLRPELLSLSTIAKTISNLNLETVALDNFSLVGAQTLQHLKALKRPRPKYFSGLN